MAKPKWTLLLIPNDQSRGLRSLNFSQKTAQRAIGAFLFLALSLGALGIGFFVKQNHHLRAERLARENDLLAADLNSLREQITGLDQAISALAEQDEKFRVIAGLPEISEDVHQVGVGGPGTRTIQDLPLSTLNPELGAKVFAATYDVEALNRRAGLLSSSMGEAIQALQSNIERLQATPTIAPSSGHLSSLFSRNRRHPVLRITRPHEGIDISAPVGEPILAPARGRVSFAGTKSGGFGLTVELEHDFGHVTRFAHASRLLVRVGDWVERGEPIAEVGATGLVTGPHLHYEVEVNGRPVDPLNYILADAIPD